MLLKVRKRGKIESNQSRYKKINLIHSELPEDALVRGRKGDNVSLPLGGCQGGAGMADRGQGKEDHKRRASRVQRSLINLDKYSRGP